jgi:hypothetical protein
MSSCGVPSFVTNSKRQLLGSLPAAAAATVVVAGSYFFDPHARVVLYAATEGWDPAASQVVLPYAETLLHMDPGTTDVSFEGVVFEHTTWLAPNEDAGYVDDQAGAHFNPSCGAECINVWKADTQHCPCKLIGAALTLDRTTNVSFRNCTFTHMGAAAIHFRAGSKGNVVSHSSFYDISASAVMIGEVADWAETNRSLQTLDNTVSDNVIYDLPMEFHGAVSVTAFISAGTRILHNDIGWSSYSAVTMGWGWHTVVGNNSYARMNVVSGNRIHDSLQLLYDGGDVYTLGSQPGSEINSNHIHGHKNCAKTNGLYHDDGSGGFDDYSNVIQFHDSCPGAGRAAPAWVSMWIAFCHNITVHDNFADVAGIVNSGTNTTVEHTTQLVSGKPLPSEAQAIVDAAGPRVVLN